MEDGGWRMEDGGWRMRLGDIKMDDVRTKIGGRRWGDLKEDGRYWVM